MPADNLARIDRKLADDYSLATAPVRPKLQLVERPPVRKPYGPVLSVANEQYLRQIKMLKDEPLKDDRYRDPNVTPRRIPCYE